MSEKQSHHSSTKSWHEQLCINLKIHLSHLKNDLFFYDILEYSVLPPGKLFRPKLAAAVYADELKHTQASQALESLKERNHTLSLICSSLEIHHSYSLVHDDLPCMDDDDYRRGRLSTHKKYGQWQAVLAGDALLHHSHSLIGRISHPDHYQLRQFFNWALGAKGLILGQVFDLGGLIGRDFPSLLRTHELKTGRLIQVSLLAGAWCAHGNLSFKSIKKYLRIGSQLGICFQLLDDLSEATEELSEHEKEVNPFLRFPTESFNAMEHALSVLTDKKDMGDQFLNSILETYFNKMKNIIQKDLEKGQDGLILKQITTDIDLSQLMTHLG